ncbi:MAG: ribonuclease III [Microcystaceae cyanobacterium]
MHQLYNFNNDHLLRLALTHCSFANENEETEDNEQLEFLGDSILNFISGEYLYKRLSKLGKKEGEMTRIRSTLVDEKQLAKFAIEIGLDLRMRLGKGLILEQGYQNENLLSSTFEALIGAYYLDQDSNIEAVKDCIVPLFESVLTHNKIELRASADSKNRLQEWVQAQKITVPPKYHTERIGGADHAPIFRSIVSVNDQEYGEGTGKNKKEAEKQAAEDALTKLSL